MTVVMIMRVKADPAKLEKYANGNADQIMRIADAAKDLGATRHMLAGGDGEVLVIDEWPSEADFQRFFASQPEIPAVMQEAGVQGEPQVSFYRKLETPDVF